MNDKQTLTADEICGNPEKYVEDTIRSLDLYQINKALFEKNNDFDPAKYLMHLFFTKFKSHSPFNPQIIGFVERINSIVTKFVKSQIDFEKQEIKQEEQRKLNIEAIITELEKTDNKIEVEYIPGVTAHQNKSYFIKGLDFDNLTKHDLFIMILEVLKNGDFSDENIKILAGKNSKNQRSNDARIRENKFEKKEEFLRFFEVYRADSGTHTGIINDYEVKNKCSGATRKFYNNHKNKILEIFPTCKNLKDFLTLLKANDYYNEIISKLC